MPKILNFANSRAKQPFKIVAKSATKAELVIYAGIGQDFWNDGSMISAKAVSDELKKLDASVTQLDIRLNSPGGDVFDGIAIYNRLKQWKGKKTVYIDGLAASIASIIALAGDEIIIGEGALYMVHLPWTFAMGNRMELDNTVSRLMDVEEQMISIYSKKTGMSRAEVKALLEAETWMDAEQAIEQGFVDSKMAESEPIAASAMGSKWFAKAPKKFNSETGAINAAKDELVKKIREKIARK
jgi:ATP-dependent protease ClpP protease subunit